MTCEEVAEALRHSDVAIVTPCAIEQHGAHLPLGTDWYIGAETTRRTLDKLAARGHRAIGYAFPLGISHKFLEFPGSLTLGHATFIRVLADICRSLEGQGFRRFVLLSGNGGNGSAMQVAAEEIHHATGVEVVFVDALPYQFSYRDEVLRDPRVENHAAEGETAKILAVHPHLVRLERAERIEPPPRATERTHFGGGVKRAHGRWADFAPRGYVGDPTLAQAATGDTMYERNSEWIAAAIEREYFGAAAG